MRGPADFTKKIGWLQRRPKLDAWSCAKQERMTRSQNWLATTTSYGDLRVRATQLLLVTH
jgi:hypothetical protein